MAQAFVAHGLILNRLYIGDVGQADATANQLGAAEANRVVPDFFQERAGIAGVGQRRIARFLRCQRLEAFGKRIPQRLNIVQTLFASRGRIANAQMPRQAAVVQQQVADGGTDIKTYRAEITELRIDGFKTVLGNKNGTAVNIAV